MASPYGLFRGADPGGSLWPPDPRPGSPSTMRTGSSGSIGSRSSSATFLDGIDDEMSMISGDKVYLLTHISPGTVYSLQIYDADEISVDPSSKALDEAERVNRETLDIFESVQFGFGFVFRLAGLSESIDLSYHETLFVDGIEHSGYSEVMGTFGRLDHVEKAHYYCPREGSFGSGFARKRTELEISIRTEHGVELFSRRWSLNILPKRELPNIYLGEPTIKVETSPAVSSNSSLSPPDYASLSRGFSDDSIGIDSFVDVDRMDLEGAGSSQASCRSSISSDSSVAVPRQPNVLQQVGMWLYGSKLGQYVANSIETNEKQQKNQFKETPIWLLGTKYDLKPTELSGFRASKLIPSKSQCGLSYQREAFSIETVIRRKQVQHCIINSSETLLDSIACWVRLNFWTISSRGSFGLVVSKDGLSISFQIFTFNGMVLETLIRSPVNKDIEAVSFLSEIMKFLQIRVQHVKFALPIVKEWCGVVHNRPESEICHVTFSWGPFSEENISANELLNEVLLWDPISADWIDAKLDLSPYGGNLTLHTMGFTALTAPVSQLWIKTEGDLVILTASNGREYFIFIKDIPARSALSARLYLLSASSNAASRPTRPASSIFRKSHELSRLQSAAERRAESERRNGINSDLIQEFLIDFGSRFWFTYRRDMPRIANTLINTDAGWGCLARCGQMMLAEAYSRILMGRGWNFIQLECGGISPDLYQSIIGLFEDRVTPTAPFGLHALVLGAASLGHPIGQWFSPTLLAHVCRDQARKTFPVHFLVQPIENGLFHLSYLRSLVQHQSLLLMIPLRLGIDQFNVYYMDLVTGCLELPQSLGIIGGKPGKSFYIVGHQEQSDLFYLDPHVTKGPPPSPVECMINREFHTGNVLAMNPSSLDPSLMFCFLARNVGDLEDLVTALSRLNVRSPVFSFMP